MLRLTENQIRLLIRHMLLKKIDPEKIRRQGSAEPGQTKGTNPAGDWRHHDMGIEDFAAGEDHLDEAEEEEEE